MFIVGTVTAPIEADVNPFRAGLSSAKVDGLNFVSQIGSALQGIGNTLVSFGSMLTKYITVPLAGAGIAAFKFGKDFESEMSKITGLVGVSRTQVKEWESDILAMSPEIAKAPQELAEAMFFVTSAGLRGADALDVLKKSGMASAAGLGETATVADLVTSAMNAYGIENLNASQATDILVAAVREGKAEASEMAASLGAVLPIASEMGVTFDQVAATTASMTKTGTDAAEASTALKSILSGLIKPSKQAEEQLKAMGTSSSEMRKKIKEEGLLSTLMDLKDLTNEYGEEALARVFPNIRAFSGALDLLGNNLESNEKTFDAVKNSTGSLDKAFQAASETVDFKWNSALSQLQATAIKAFGVIKTAVLPVLEIFINTLGFLGDKFASLSPFQQQAIALFGVMAAAIGPIIMVIGTAIATLGGFITMVSTAILALSATIATVGLPVLAAIAAAIAVVIAGIGAVIAIIATWVASFVYLYKNNAQFRAQVISTWNSIKANAKIIFNEIKKVITYVLTAIKTFWKKNGNDIMAYVKSAWSLIFSIIKIAMTQIKNIVKLISALIRGDWSAAWSSIKSIIKTSIAACIVIVKGLKNTAVAYLRAMMSTSISILSSLASRMGSLFSALRSAALSKIKSMISGIGSLLGSLASKGRSAGQRFVSAIRSINFSAAGRAIVQGVINGIKSMLGSLGSVASSMAATVRNKLPFSPAKEGPLKDLDKLNFAGPIMTSLNKASNIIKDDFLGDLLLNAAVTPGTNTSSNTATNISGPLIFNGIQDINDFMQQMKDTLKRYGGKF